MKKIFLIIAFSFTILIPLFSAEWETVFEKDDFGDDTDTVSFYRYIDYCNGSNYADGVFAFYIRKSEESGNWNVSMAMLENETTVMRLPGPVIKAKTVNGVVLNLDNFNQVSDSKLCYFDDEDSKKIYNSLIEGNMKFSIRIGQKNINFVLGNENLIDFYDIIYPTNIDLSKWDYVEVPEGTYNKAGEMLHIDSFYVGKSEVTQKEWNDVMSSNPSRHLGDFYPVERVSWMDAIEYCNKRSKKEGLEECYYIIGKDAICDFDKNGYRLLTDDEWVYAAKGGPISKGYMFSGSNNVFEIGWFELNSLGMSHKVGIRNPNELGIYDMSGNVEEWCYSTNNDSKPRRGGSWRDRSNVLLINRNNYSSQISSFSYLGFRIARTTLDASRTTNNIDEYNSDFSDNLEFDEDIPSKVE